VQFLVDENAGVVVARWLRNQGHDIFSVYEAARGIDDDTVIQKAFDENRILITSDKDFGEKVYRERRSHRGIILLRLANEYSANKIDVLQKLLTEYPEQLCDNFIVVTEKLVRFAKAKS
jgi:predicted nuclease of predicted toxin-antitoxin system